MNKILAELVFDRAKKKDATIRDFVSQIKINPYQTVEGFIEENINDFRCDIQQMSRKEEWYYKDVKFMEVD